MRNKELAMKQKELDLKEMSMWWPRSHANSMFSRHGRLVFGVGNHVCEVLIINVLAKYNICKVRICVC